MKRIITLLLLFFSMNFFAQEQSLDKILKQKDVFLVDVRTPKEFSAGSVKGAVNIPLDVLEKELAQFKGKKNIILFCRSGKRSEKARNFLQKNGIEAHNGINTENMNKILNTH